jgi:hypothetical protein
LTGKAERVYKCMDETKKKSFDEVSKALVAGCSQPQEVLLYAFYNRKPHSGEQLSTFALALQDLLNKAVPLLDEKHKAIFLRAQLAMHLPDHMRALIQFNANKTWDELLVAMDQAMPFVTANSGTNTIFNHDSVIASGVKTEPVEVNSTSAKRVAGGRFGGTCHYCNKKRHRVADCWKKQQDEGALRASKNRGQAVGASRRQAQGTVGNSRPNNERGGRGRGGHQAAVNAMSLDDKDDSYVDANALSVDVVSGENLNKEANVAVCFAKDDSELSVVIKPNNGSGEIFGDRGSLSGIPVLDLLALSTSVPLMCKDIKLHLPSDIGKVKLRALFDGGATNSFIKASCLPVSYRAKLDVLKKDGQNGGDASLRCSTICIRGATGAVQETCVLATLSVSIGRWSGEHEFIVTEGIVDKQVILGRDFLKKNGVVINHGSDSISINSSQSNGPCICLGNEVCALVNNVTVEPNSEHLVDCRFKSILRDC